MIFVEAISVCFSKYVSISGRDRRSEFWFFFLFVTAGYLITGMLDGVLMAMGIFPLVGLAFWLGTLLPYCTVSIRRMHDQDKSGWWLLVGLIPLIGWIILIVLLAKDGTAGTNRFGKDAKGRAAEVTVG